MNILGGARDRVEQCYRWDMSRHLKLFSNQKSIRKIFPKTFFSKMVFVINVFYVFNACNLYHINCMISVCSRLEWMISSLMKLEHKIQGKYWFDRLDKILVQTWQKINWLKLATNVWKQVVAHERNGSDWEEHLLNKWLSRNLDSLSIISFRSSSFDRKMSN